MELNQETGFVILSSIPYDTGGFLRHNFMPSGGSGYTKKMTLPVAFDFQASGLDPSVLHTLIARVANSKRSSLFFNSVSGTPFADMGGGGMDQFNVYPDAQGNISGTYSMKFDEGSRMPLMDMTWGQILVDSASAPAGDITIDALKTTRLNNTGGTVYEGAWFDRFAEMNPSTVLTRQFEGVPYDVYLATMEIELEYEIALLSIAGGWHDISTTTIKVPMVFALELVNTTFSTNSNPPAEVPILNIPITLDGSSDQVWTPVTDQACAAVTPSKPFEYSEAMKRDFATAPADNLQIHTLEIYCAEDPQQESYFLCNDLQDHTLTTEEGETRLFQAANFSFTLPQTNGDGAPEMQVAISNINGEVFGYIDRVRDFGPIVIKYRPFLANDTSAPQTTHPLSLFLSEISADPFQVTGRVSFVDILNKSFPSIKYNVASFPNIYG